MHRLLSRLTYSNVVSSLCLVLVLGGGTAFAATKLGKNSVGTKQLQKGAVSAAKLAAGSVDGEKVENESLTGADIKASTLGTVPTADQARTATTAQSAQTAQSAKTADSASTAKTAESAKTAQSATTAQTANVASTASSAQTAGSAITAQTAVTAAKATVAETAAKATVAEGLVGHSPFSAYLAEGEREVRTVGALAVKLKCAPEEAGQEVGRISIAANTAEGTALVIAGKGTGEVPVGEERDAFALKAAKETKAAAVGPDATVVPQNEAGFTISDPTIGFNLNGAHAGQCYFSGVIQQLPELP